MYPECIIASWDAKDRKNMRIAYFTTKLNIPISHYGEMIEFSNFKVSCYFLSELNDFILSTKTIMSNLRSSHVLCDVM